MFGRDLFLDHQPQHEGEADQHNGRHDDGAVCDRAPRLGQLDRLTPGAPLPYRAPVIPTRAPLAPGARTSQTRRTTLQILQRNQRPTRSVPNPEVISFGENGSGREPFGPSGADAGQQVQLGMPVAIGLLRPSPTGERLSDRQGMAEEADLKSNGLYVLTGSPA